MTDNHDNDRLRLRTIKEAEEFLGVGRNTIYRLVEQGKLELVKVKAASRITQKSLDAYVTSQLK